MAASLTLSREWLAMFDALADDAARGRLLRAVSGYALYGVTPKGLTETEQGYFARMRRTIDHRRRTDRWLEKRTTASNSDVLPSNASNSDASNSDASNSDVLPSNASNSDASNSDANTMSSNQHRNTKVISPSLNNKLFSPPQGEKPPKNGALPRTARRFVPPTVEDVATYCRERNNGIDPQAFFDHHEAVGWVIGKNKTPVKDWRAVIRQWERTQKDTKDKNKPKKRDYSGF